MGKKDKKSTKAKVDRDDDRLGGNALFSYVPADEEERAPLPYEAKNRNLIYPNYEPINFSTIYEYSRYNSEKALYYALYQEFETSIGTNFNVLLDEDDDNDKKLALFNQLKKR